MQAYAPPFRPVRQAWGYMATGVVVFGATMLLGIGLFVVFLHLALQPVLSGSMRPGIEPGDMAVTAPVAMSSLVVGDVIAYFPPGEKVAVLHRIVELGREDGRTWVVTKGDANPTPDAWGKVLLRGDKAVRLLTVAPKVGFVANLGQVRGPALVLAGLILAAGVIVGVLRRD